MTIAIVAVTQPDDIFVCVSDRMISYGDEFPSEDNALIKTIAIGDDWHIAYSARDVKFILPMIEDARAQLAAKNLWPTEEVKGILSNVFVQRIRKEFVTKRLLKYDYRTVEDFRANGRQDLGDHFFQFTRELDNAELHTEFIVYGYNEKKQPVLFSVSGAGEIEDNMAFKYAVIGSGYPIALASLKRRPLRFDLETTIYRLLEAKFAAESSSAVGKESTMVLKNRDGQVAVVAPATIQTVRDEWRKTIEAADPEAAIDCISKAKAVTLVSGGER